MTDKLILKPVGTETHRATGIQYVSFRVVEGRFPSGPWRRLWAVEETDIKVALGDEDPNQAPNT